MHSIRLRIKIILPLLTGLVLVAGCEKAQPLQPESANAPVYSATIFNVDGGQIAIGYLAFTKDPVFETQLNGAWSFTPQEERDNINNPFTGTGTLEGTVQHDSLAVNLHPGWADHNIYLHGQVHGDSLTGLWTWVGFPGIIDRGRFAAIRR